MAARIRAFDWASTPLGPIDTWPQTLTTAVDMILAAPLPMWIGWGPDLIQLYNDRYTTLVDAERHATALGQPAAEAWADIWSSIGADFLSILAGGPAVSYTDRHIPHRRHHEIRDLYFTYSYSPILDAQAPSGVGGVLCIAIETTERVLAERSVREGEERQAYLLKLADALRPLDDPIAVQGTAARILGEHLGVSVVAYGEVFGDDVVVTRDYVAEGTSSVAGRYRMTDYGEALVASMRQGHSIAVPDIATAEQLSPAERAAYAEVGIGALAGVPLVKEGRFVAYLNVHHHEPRTWTGADIALVEETAERTWNAVERARAEAALRQSEVRLSALVMATARFTYRMSPDWSEVRELYRLGVLADIDTPNQEWIMSYLVPEDRPQVLEAIEAATRARDVFELEHRFRRDDGTFGWMLSRAVPILDERGEILEWFGTASDVTDRKRAEEALRESEEAYRTLFTAMDQGFCVLEEIDTASDQPSDFRFISANPAFGRHTGLQDVVGKTIRELDPNANQEIMDICTDAVRTGQPRRFEAYVVAMDLWVDAEVIPSHEPGQVAVLFSNISDRKRAEATLRESEARQAFLLSLSDMLRPLSDAIEIQGEACRVIGEYLNADRTYYCKVDHARGVIDVSCDYVRGDGPSLVGQYDFGTYRTVMERISDGRAWVVDDVTVADELLLEERELLTGLEVNAWIDVPLVRQGKLVAILCVTQRAARQWADHEARLVEEAADRAWAAVERARAEAALRTSETRLRALVTASSYVIYRMSRDWSEMRQLDGRGFLADTDQPSTHWIASYIEPEDRPRVLAAIEAAIRAKDVFELEHRVRRADGTVGWTLSRAVPILDESGEIVEWFGAASDVTERKRGEEALRASEERLRRMINIEGAGVLVFSADGTLIGSNDYFRAMMGYRRDVIDARKLTWRAMTPPEYVVETEAQMRRLEEEGRIGPYEKEYIRVDGSRVWMLFAGASLGDGTIVEYCIDISDRKRAEAELRDSESRQAFLLRLGDALQPLEDPAEIEAVACRQLADYLVAQRATVPVHAGEPEPVTVRFVVHEHPVASSGRAYVTTDVDASEDVPDAVRSAYRAYGIRAIATIPLARGGFLVATLGVVSTVVSEWTPGDVWLFRQVAERLWAAIERAESRSALRASEERLQHMVNIEGVGVLVFDMDGTLINANDHFLAMTGYDRDRIAAGELTWRTMTPAEHIPVSEAQMRRMEREGRIGPYEKEYFLADGTRSWMLFAGASLGDGTIVEYCIDIGDRKRAEAALRETEGRFRAIANLVPDLLWQSEPDGSTDWYNDRWYEYTGQTRDEAAGWGWLQAIHPDDRERSAARYIRAVERGEPLLQEHRIRAADGSYCWFQMRAEPLRDERGMIVQWFASATDVNEARVARDELEGRVAAATAELRALSQRLLVVQEEERRHLSRELHDEIGQVLTGLSINLRPGTGNPDERLAGARQIVHDLTNQVRQLSTDLRPSALDSHGLLPALLWHIERYQDRTGVRVDLRHEGLEGRFPPAVEITAYRVVQEALTNVARHAEVREATVQLLATDGTLVVSVRDRGIGFKLRARTESSGLSGMRERTRLVGGTISIDTAPGEGTIVTVELPIDQHATAAVSGEGP